MFRTFSKYKSLYLLQTIDGLEVGQGIGGCLVGLDSGDAGCCTAQANEDANVGMLATTNVHLKHKHKHCCTAKGKRRSEIPSRSGWCQQRPGRPAPQRCTQRRSGQPLPRRRRERNRPRTEPTLDVRGQERSERKNIPQHQRGEPERYHQPSFQQKIED